MPPAATKKPLKVSPLEKAIEEGKARLQAAREVKDAADRTARDALNYELDEAWKRVVEGVDAILGELALERVSLPRPADWKPAPSMTTVKVQFSQCAPITVYLFKQSIYGKDSWVATRDCSVFMVLWPYICEGTVQWWSVKGLCTNLLVEAVAQARLSWEEEQRLKEELKKDASLDVPF